MARKTLAPVLCLAALAFVATRGPAFIPGRPLQKPAAATAGAAAAMLGAAPAFADKIGDAAKALADASFPFAKQVNWNNGIFLQPPGKVAPLDALQAIDKMIVFGVQADPKLLRAATLAHHNAIGSISGANGMTSKGDWEQVNAALGRLFASVPEKTVMDVYNSVSKITDKGVPAYMKSLVNGKDADAAYAAFLKFKDVVKAEQVKAAGPAPPAAADDAIGAAAGKLASASYPFLKDIDWLSSVYTKPLPGVSAQQALKAVDKAIVLGTTMDGGLLQAAANAHHKAIGSIDAKGVTSQADYEATLAGIGRIIASAPTSKVMDVYNAFSSIVPASVPNNMIASVNAADANAAAEAFYKFKDVVKASR